MTNAFLAVLEKKDDGDLQYHELMDALHRELSRKRMCADGAWKSQ